MTSNETCQTDQSPSTGAIWGVAGVAHVITGHEQT